MSDGSKRHGPDIHRRGEQGAWSAPSLRSFPQQRALRHLTGVRVRNLHSTHTTKGMLPMKFQMFVEQSSLPAIPPVTSSVLPVASSTATEPPILPAASSSSAPRAATVSSEGSVSEGCVSGVATSCMGIVGVGHASALRRSPPGWFLVYESEAVPPTCNPTWRPVEFDERTLPAEAFACTKFLIRLMGPVPSEASGIPAGTDAFSSDGMLLHSTVIDLGELVFLDPTARIVGTSAGGGGVAGIGIGGSVGTSSALAGAALYGLASPGAADGGGMRVMDALPINTVLIDLVDGSYVEPAVHTQLLAAGLYADSQALDHKSADLAPLHILPSLSAWKQLSDIHQQNKAVSGSIVSARLKISGLFEEKARVLSGASAVADARKRIEALRVRRDLKAAQVAKLRAEVEDARTKSHGRAVALEAASNALESTHSKVETASFRSESSTEDLKLAKELLDARRLSLVSELRGVYPIFELEADRMYTIRGAKLPDAKSMVSYEEEEVSTALGYTVHLVMLLSKYLEVPLRYTPRHLGSKSELRDELISFGTTYPLYWKGVDQRQFRVAVTMLQRNVKQLLHSQGLVISEKKHMLGALSTLFVHLLGGLPMPA